MPQFLIERVYNYPSRDTAIVFIYNKDVKYSMNILLASLEKEDLHRSTTIYAINIKSSLEEKEDLTDLVESIRELENKHERIVIGMTLLTTNLSQTLPLIETLREHRSRSKRITLIAGGPHATGDPLGTLNLGFDIVFVGEGEKAFTRFTEEYLVNKRDDLANIPNIVYRVGEEIKRNKYERLSSLDEYPPFPVEAGRYNPIEITRGCPFACRFCEVSFMFSARMIHRSIENILAYTKIMLSNNMRDIRFITPNALGYGSSDKRPSYDNLHELLSSLHDLVIKRSGGRVFFGTFPSEIRPEYVDEETADMLKKYVSNKKIIIGAQTGSERLLKLINRGHSVEDVLRAAELLSSRGFTVDVDFIFGLPGETREDVLETIDLMKKILDMGGRVHAHYFLPLPGTPLSGCRPSPIDPLIIRFLNRYRGSGRVYGYLDEQIKMSQSIVGLIEKKYINVSICLIDLIKR